MRTQINNSASAVQASPDDQVLLLAENVSRRFGYRLIIREASLSLVRGGILTILGPNGAGKTTLLRMLAGLTKPTSGTVRRMGSVDAVMHGTMLYDSLSAMENLTFAARLRGKVNSELIEEHLKRVGLWQWRFDRVGTFSRGMQQRLAIARALLSDPDVLLLDEPLSSLDDPGEEMLLGILDQFAGRGKSVAMVTHQFSRIAQVTTSVAYLIAGVLRGPYSAEAWSADEVMTEYRRRLSDA